MTILTLIFLNVFYWLLAQGMPFKVLERLLRKKIKKPLDKGEQLYSKMGHYIPGVFQSRTNWGGDSSSQYKFFYCIAQELIELNRTLGAPIKGPWGLLRRSLQKDLSFQRKIDSLKGQAYGQIFVMSFFLFLFAFMFSYISDSSPSIGTWLVLVIMNGCAWFFYRLGLNKLQIRQWNGAAEILYVLVSIESLVKTGLSSSEIYRRAKGHQLMLVNDKHFSIIQRQFGVYINAWQKNGAPIGEAISELQVEFWFVMEQKLQDLIKHVQALQLCCTFIFILPAFFFLVASSFSAFLI